MEKLRVALALAALGSALAVVIPAGCSSGDDEPSDAAADASSDTGGDTGGSTTDSPEAPTRMVALTARGDVIAIDRLSLTAEATLASFPSRKDAETGIIYGRADDLTALPGEQVLVSTCCEPAGGAIALLAAGERHDKFSGWDPQVDPTGERVAIGGIPGITIHESLAPRPAHMLESAPGLLEPEDPSWSPDGREVAFSSLGRLGVVPVTAASLTEADIVEPDDETYWTAPAYTTEGVVAVAQSGSWGPGDPSGPSTLFRVDPATGEKVELVSSSGPITDVSVDASGRHLLWVDDGRLHWQIAGATGSFGRNFVAAAWLPTTG